MTTVMELTEENFDQEATTGTVMIKFGAVWCQPCRMIAPVLAKIAGLEACKVGSVDIDESPDLTKKFGVRGVPTILVLKDGVEVARHVGMATSETLLALLP